MRRGRGDALRQMIDDRVLPEIADLLQPRDGDAQVDGDAKPRRGEVPWKCARVGVDGSVGSSIKRSESARRRGGVRRHVQRANVEKAEERVGDIADDLVVVRADSQKAV